MTEMQMVYPVNVLAGVTKPEHDVKLEGPYKKRLPSLKTMQSMPSPVYYAPHGQ